MTDVTPSPAADGPFSLISDVPQDTKSKPRSNNPLINQLLSEGKTPDEIMKAFAESAGWVSDV
jgi:hypothetical protein